MKRFVWIGLLLFVALFFGACGGGGSDSSGVDNITPTATTSTADMALLAANLNQESDFEAAVEELMYNMYDYGDYGCSSGTVAITKNTLDDYGENGTVEFAYSNCTGYEAGNTYTGTIKAVLEDDEIKSYEFTSDFTLVDASRMSNASYRDTYIIANGSGEEFSYGAELTSSLLSAEYTYNGTYSKTNIESTYLEGYYGLTYSEIAGNLYVATDKAYSIRSMEEELSYEDYVATAGEIVFDAADGACVVATVSDGVWSVVADNSCNGSEEDSLDDARDSDDTSSTSTANVSDGDTLVLGTKSVGRLETSDVPVWFSFDAVEGTEYSIVIEDYFANDGTEYEADVVGSVYHTDRSTIYQYSDTSGGSAVYNFEDVDDYGYTLRYVRADETGKIHIKVGDYDGSYLGSFSVTVTQQ